MADTGGAPALGDYAADLARVRAFLDSTTLADAAPRRQELFALEHSMTIAKALEVSGHWGGRFGRGSQEHCRRGKKKAAQVSPSASPDPLINLSLALPPSPSVPAPQSFQAKRILSAPLVVAPDLEDLTEGGLDGGGGAFSDEGAAAATPQLLGWVDTADILRAFLAHLDAHLAAEGRPLPTRMLELMTLLEKVGPGFAARPLVTVADGGDRALVYEAGPAHSLLAVMRDQFLGPAPPAPASGAGSSPPRPQRVVHRVAIFDGRGGITAIVSQLDVMRCLLRAGEGVLGRLGGASLVDLGLVAAGRPPVKTVAPDTPTLLALRDMLAAGVSGAAVCHTGSGEMIANLSVSDVRAIQPTHLSALALPVCELLAVIHRTTYAGYSAGASKHSSHPFFQHRAGGGPGVASRGLRPPPGGSPTASVATTGTAATESTQAAYQQEATSTGAGDPGGGGGAPASRGPTPPPSTGMDDGDVRLITCPPTTSLACLLELFLTHGVHRVYVATDPERPVPVGVVSPTDVMRLLVGGG